MRPRTLQGRLIGAAVLAVVVAVACLGVTAEIVVSHRLRSSLDSSLRRQAQDVARLSVSAPALLTAPGALDASVSGRQLSVEVLDRHGRLLARSVSLGAKLLPQAAVAGEALRLGRSGFADARLDRDPVRLFAAPLPDEGGPATGGVVLVASSTTDIDATLHRLSLLPARPRGSRGAGCARLRGCPRRRPRSSGPATPRAASRSQTPKTRSASSPAR